MRIGSKTPQGSFPLKFVSIGPTFLLPVSKNWQIGQKLPLNSTYPTSELRWGSDPIKSVPLRPSLHLKGHKVLGPSGDVRGRERDVYTECLKVRFTVCSKFVIMNVQWITKILKIIDTLRLNFTLMLT